MSKQDEQFRPELLDEQIETLYVQPEDSSASARLVSDLYQISKEDSEIVEQVWTRLTEHIAEKNSIRTDQANTSDSSLRARREDARKERAYMKLPNTGRRSRFLELAVAVLILGILVGSTVLFLQAQQSSPTTGKLSISTEAPTKTIPLTGDQTGLYITAPDKLARIDLQTNKTIWSKATRYPMPVITRGIVIFNSQESSQPLADSLLEAVNAANGQELWHKHYMTVSNHQAVNGVVYASLCDRQCSISALKADDGEQLWSYDTSRLGTPRIQVRDGVVYGIMNTQFFALNATTGALIWQKSLPYSSGQQASTAPQVINKVLYFASCETQPTSTPVPSYLYAIDATNGEELWHTQVDGPILASLIAADDTVYAGSNAGLLYALDARTGSILWTYNTGDLMIKSLLTTTGTIYIETVTQNGSSAHLLALNATDRSLIWSKDLGAIGGPGSDWQTLALENGLIYAVEGQNVSVFHLEDGSVVKSYSVAGSAPLAGFSVVLQNE